MVEDWLFSNSMLLMNDNDWSLPTFQTIRAQSNIDLTIVNYQMLSKVHEWNVSELESFSDHKYILFEISSPSFRCHNSVALYHQYNIHKADWNKFDQVLNNGIINLIGLEGSADVNDTDEALSEHFEIAINLNEIVDDFLGVVKLSCDQSIPKRGTNNKHKSVHWWNKELSELRKQVNHKRRRYQRTRMDNSIRNLRKQEYYQLKIKYKSMILTAKLESWKEYCDATSKSQPWNYIYKAAAGKLKYQTVFTNLQREDGSYTRSIDETLNLLLDKYVPFDDSRTDNEYHRQLRAKAKQTISTHNDRPFTLREIKSVIDSFNKKKAPGEDGHTQHIVARVFCSYPSAILSLFNQCLQRGVFPTPWKKTMIISIIKPGKENSEGVDKYRPISLISLWGKMLEKLLIGRIMFYLNSNDLLSGRQFGFTPQRSTVDALMNVKGFIDEGLRNKEVVLCISLDVKGAFDAAWWPSLLSQLQDFQCPGNLYKLTVDYFSDRTATIRTNSATIIRIVTKGCPQGSCSGPGFWIIQYDSLLKEDFPSSSLVVAFADDLFIVVRGKTVAEAECTGNCCLRIVEHWSYKNKIEFNSKKSKVLPISRKPGSINTSLYLGRENLQVVHEFKYLGVIFDTKFTWNNHINWISEKSLKLTNMLSRSAKVHWGVGAEALRIIYEGAMVPLLMYAVPVWLEALKKRYNRIKLNRVQRLFLLRVIKGFRTISFEATCILANEAPITLKAVEFARNYMVERELDGEWQTPVEKPIEFHNWMHPAEAQNISVCLNVPSDTEMLDIYTDGSKLNDRVGCAFVAYKTRDNIQSVVAEEQNRLADCCSNNQAEQLAIVTAMRWMLLQCEGNNSMEIPKKIIIRTDSRISLFNLQDSKCHLPLVEEARRILAELRQQYNLNITFAWIKAHTGQEGNERADTLAKQASQDEDLPITFSSAPKSFLKAKLAEATLQEWESIWSSTGKGLHTKGFFPTVQARRQSSMAITYKLTQVLSGHGRNREYLSRFNIIESGVCPCDAVSQQTWDHLMFDCSMFERERGKLIRTVVTGGGAWPPSKSDLVTVLVNHFMEFVDQLDWTKL